MLRYFWEEKQDLTRCWYFEELKPALLKEYPEILAAWSDYQASIRTMDAVIKAL